MPRFAYEEHLKSLAGPDRRWPESTRRIAQLRLTIEFENASGWGSRRSSLTVDIVDYPGEWLLDLPLLDKSYAEWSRETLAASQTPARAPLAEQWRARAVGLDPQAPPTRTRRGGSPNCSPPISSARATTSMRSRLCRPAGS